MSENNSQHIRIDERSHVELPFLNQLTNLGWQVIDPSGQHQTPDQSHRENFSEVVMFPILRRQLIVINDWLEDDQVDEVIKHLTANFPGTSLIENNQFALHLLLQNTSVSENRKTGEISPTVRYIDFKNPENNNYTAVCQFKVRIPGTEHHILPDIVLFLNGLPVVVVECKSPRIKEPIPQAIDQLMRYCEQRGEKGEGNSQLFNFNQFIIATCRQEAKFGTITTDNEKHFYRWSDPFPLTLNDLDRGESSPNDQQRLIAGMLSKQNLLDLIRTFTIFSVNESGQTIKIVGRYQQFRAVKLAINRLLEGNSPRERGGIIWHTQGSGKSLTMMFMVREMYQHSTLASWKVVFVTDRTQLEDQLNETSQSIGFTVKVANSIAELKNLLRSDTSDLIMAMIHKFRETDLKETFPLLNSSPNILVMTDEAHRSQYKLLGANLDKAIPNATKIGYTGTPIDKTERVFGDYIDKYTMRQAIDDGVILEIVYEGRTHKAEVADKEGMDKAFADVFSDYNLEERLQILGFGSRDAYLEAESTVETKAKDMIQHYLTHIFPNGYKAQVVASTREAAVRYKKHLDLALKDEISKLEKNNPLGLNLVLLKNMQTDIIFSGDHNDLPHLKEFSDKSRQDRSIKSFKMKFEDEDAAISGNMGILVVVNMLITGFNAPVEQVMYLDRIVTDHNLLQAIARVNRVSGETKEKGLIVDYVGIGHHLKKAIDAYDEREQAEIIDVLSFPEEELRNLQESHKAILDFFEQYGLTNFSDFDAFYDLFYDEDIRFEYMQKFRQFTKCMNLVFPSREALEYLGDYNTLTEINLLASKHFRDSRLSMRGIPPKLRAITDQYLISKGIDQTIEPISILDKDFEKDVKKHARTKNKASAIEHAIRHHLDVELIDDPDLQASFYEALQKIFEEFRDNWQKIYEELERLRQRILDTRKEPTFGLHRKKQMPFFRSLKREIHNEDELDDDQISTLVNLTQRVYLVIEREIKLTGFWNSFISRNKLRAEIQSIILNPEFIRLPGMFQNRDKIISRLMEISEKNNDIILYAE